MKRNSGGIRLPVMMLIWGIAALVLRKTLYTTAVDIKGLLLRYHPLEIALVVLTIGVLIRILVAVRKLDTPGGYAEHSVSGILGAIGNVAAGAGILVTVLTAAPGMGGYLETIWRYLGLAAPVCLLLAGIARLLGKKPFFLLYVVVCLFFVLHIVTHYQFWSGDPQLQNYIFTLLGTMALMFFAFYSATLEAGCGSPRIRLGMGLAAIYLCTAELARSYCPALYFGSILWVLTELVNTVSPSEGEDQ